LARASLAPSGVGHMADEYNRPLYGASRICKPVPRPRSTRALPGVPSRLRLSTHVRLVIPPRPHPTHSSRDSTMLL
jgi:hypothetical protein